MSVGPALVVSSSVLPEVVAAAVVGALSPVPALGAIMLLTTRRPVANTLACLLGWTVLLLALAVGLAALLQGQAGASGTSAKAAVQLVVGLLLTCLALRNLIGERHPLEGPVVGEHLEARRIGEPPPPVPAEAPGWLQRLERVTVPEAFVVGVILIAISPGDLAAFFAGLQGVIGSDLSDGGKYVVVALLVVAIDLCILAPLITYLVFPRRAPAWLQTAKLWLIAHQRAVTGGAAGVFGVVLLVNGVVALA